MAPRTTNIVETTRLLLGITVVAILVLGFILDWSGQAHNAFNYFGYFTNLTSLLTGVVFIVTAVRGLRRAATSAPLVLCRAVATTCMVVVAIVYNGLVPGTGSAPLWVSVSLHAVFPVLVFTDWILVDDHRGLRWSQLWLVLPYPMFWLAIVLIRGVADGWVPYGFLLPERGVVSLLLHVSALSCALLVTGSIVWATSRIRAPERR